MVGCDLVTLLMVLQVRLDCRTVLDGTLRGANQSSSVFVSLEFLSSEVRSETQVLQEQFDVKYQYQVPKASDARLNFGGQNSLKRMPV